MNKIVSQKALGYRIEVIGTITVSQSTWSDGTVTYDEYLIYSTHSDSTGMFNLNIQSYRILLDECPAYTPYIIDSGATEKEIKE